MTPLDTPEKQNRGIFGTSVTARQEHKAAPVGGWSDVQGLRHNNLDFARFVLASLVIFEHAFQLATRSHYVEPLRYLTREQMGPGELAVNWFFVISGFLITHSWMTSRTPRDFIRKRVLRIYPGFIAVALVCGLIVAPLAMTNPRQAFLPRQIVQFFACLPFLRAKMPLGTFTDNPFPGWVNASLWTIPYEFWCYLGLALCGLTGLLKRRGLLVAVLAVALLVNLAFLVFRVSPGSKTIGSVFGYRDIWARLGPYFLSGMVFYLYREYIPATRTLAVASLFIMAGSCWCPHGLAVTLPIAGTYLLFYFTFHPAMRLNNWARHGDFSYGIYLYGFPIQQLLALWWGRPMSPWLHFLIAWPLTLLAGMASWHLVEKHFLRHKLTRQEHEMRSLPPAVTLPRMSN